MKKIKKYKKNLIVMLVLLAILIASFIPMLQSNSTYTWNEIYNKFGLRDEIKVNNSPLSVHYIDVGQGDCTLIKSKDFIMLIDSGEDGNERKIIKYLKSQEINNIDYLVATHPHSDHIGCMSKIIGSFEIKNIIMPKLSVENIPTTQLYKDLLKAVQKSKAKVTLIDKPIRYEHGNTRFEILSPCKQYDNLNNMSVIIKLIFENHSFLFMGDAEKEVEQDLLSENIKCDILKVSHHGSETSSIDEFIKLVKPSMGIISCGKDNCYGHPSEQILDTLNKYNVDVKRTDLNGTIVVSSDGKLLKVDSQKEK